MANLIQSLQEIVASLAAAGERARVRVGDEYEITGAYKAGSDGFRIRFSYRVRGQEVDVFAFEKALMRKNAVLA